MNSNFRKIMAGDVAELFVVRSSVYENPFSVEGLAQIGITVRSVTDALGQWLDGYLCETADRIVGFAMADLKAGELSVIAVLPEYEGQGFGRELLRLTEELLWLAGYAKIWLWTPANRGTRAYHLYLATGWAELETKEDKLFMTKVKPCGQILSAPRRFCRER